MPTFILLLVLAYLAGSINFSILLFRLTGREDPRQHGSGNPGATNVYRQAGAVWAAVVLLLDMGRAIAVAVLAQRLLNDWQVPWVGLGLILGNRFPRIRPKPTQGTCQSFSRRCARTATAMARPISSNKTTAAQTAPACR